MRSRDWELFVTYNVHGSKGDLYGDGMAIWYAKERTQLGKEAYFFFSCVRST